MDNGKLTYLIENEKDDTKKLKEAFENFEKEQEECFHFPDLSHFSTTQLKAELRRRRKKVASDGNLDRKF